MPNKACKKEERRLKVWKCEKRENGSDSLHNLLPEPSLLADIAGKGESCVVKTIKKVFEGKGECAAGPDIRNEEKKGTR